MRKHVFRLIAFLLAVGAAGFAATGQEYVWDGDWVEAAEPGEPTPEGQIALIRLQLDQGEYREAARTADRFIEAYPNHENTEMVMDLAGQAEIRRGRYYKAYEWYERQLTAYPGGPLARRALHRKYEIAEAFLEGEKRVVLGFIPVSAVEDGLRILDDIAAREPGSDIAEKALLRIAEHHYEQQQYERAVDAYDRYADMFPQGERVAHALLQAARTTREMYLGPDFDDTPLVEARHRFSHFAERFPRQAEERNIAETIRRIDSERAEKDFETAEFYRRTGRDDAAEFYYRQVVRRYGQTDWAEYAAQRLEWSDRQVEQETGQERQ